MQERRLAAIMFTDIVGYTALMGSDEDRAFEVLHKNREIHTQLIQKFKGTLIKEMGDGMLVSFNLASDAAQCAIEIQKRAREELNGQIRIGIHLGDITFENEDVFGDGVNIASRLHSITDPGGIYLSESLQKSIRGKSEIKTKYLGEFILKNVDYPVRTYSVQGAGLPIPSTEKINKLKGKSLKGRIFGSPISYIVFLLLLISSVWWVRSQFFTTESTLTSLLVLPVDNLTGSDTLDYIMAGMHSSLITDIGKISSLRVPSKTTANAYKVAEKSLTEIATELNLNYLIEPSILCFGDTICLRINLLSASPEEVQIWSQDYYIAKSQILNWSNKVTKEISEEINIILTPHEERLLAETRSVDNDAYDAYLKGQFLLDQINEESLKQAITYFNIAIKIEPEWAAPYAGLAEVGSYQNQMGFGESSGTIQMIKENLNIALELDPNSAYSHYANAIIAVWTEWNWEKGEREFLKALELNPNSASSHMFYAHLLTILRRTDEALHHGKMAKKRDPLNAFNLGLYARVLLYSGDCQAAIVQAEEGLSIEPDHYFTNSALLAASTCIEDYEKAFEIMKYFFNYELWKEYKVAASLEKIFHEDGWSAFMEEIIRINEEVWAKDGHLDINNQALKYMAIKKYDKALDYYEKAYERHGPNLPYISAKDTFNKMKDNPRYIALLKKMNLPVD